MSTDFIESFGLAVRRLREGRGWSQEKLAEHSNLNRSYIGEIERGKVIASLLTVRKLSSALELSGADLLRQSEQINNARMVKSIKLMSIAC